MFCDSALKKEADLRSVFSGYHTISVRLTKTLCCTGLVLMRFGKLDIDVNLSIAYFFSVLLKIGTESMKFEAGILLDLIKISQ